MCRRFDAGNMEIYDRPETDAFVKRWGEGKLGEKIPSEAFRTSFEPE